MSSVRVSLAEAKWWPRALEIMFGKKLLKRFLEKVHLMAFLEGGVIMPQYRVQCIDRLSRGVFTMIFKPMFEILKIYPIQRPGWLIKEIGGGIAIGRWNRGDQFHIHEQINALVQDLGGHFDHAAQLRGRAWWQTVLPAPSNGEQHDK